MNLTIKQRSQLVRAAERGLDRSRAASLLAAALLVVVIVAIAYWGAAI